MKVVILCVGEGTRMREETEFRPKPLVEIGGKPILWHIMKIYSYYGFNEFVLALGYKSNLIKDYFLQLRTLVNDFTLDTATHGVTFHTGNQDAFKITFVETGVKTPTGERVRRLKPYLNDDYFMLTYGDGVADISIKSLKEFAINAGTLATITGVDPITRYGIITKDIDSHRAKDFRQYSVSEFKTEGGVQAHFVNGGFMVFKKDFIDRISPDSMIEEVFPILAKAGELSVYRHLGKWKAMDTFKEYEELNYLWENDPFWKVW